MEERPSWVGRPSVLMTMVVEVTPVKVVVAAALAAALVVMEPLEHQELLVARVVELDHLVVTDHKPLYI